jgi:hypothetical protein
MGEGIGEGLSRYVGGGVVGLFRKNCVWLYSACFIINYTTRNQYYGGNDGLKLFAP